MLHRTNASPNFLFAVFAYSVEYGFGKIDLEAVIGRDMRGDLRKLLAFGVNKLAADGALEVKMLVATAMTVVHLIAGGRVFHYIFSQFTIFRQAVYRTVDRRLSYLQTLIRQLLHDVCRREVQLTELGYCF